jgi:hypothetical protein
MTWTQEQTEIKRGLNTIMKACGFDQSESSTEAFFEILDSAVGSVAEQREAVVEESHRDGLCFDVNAMLAREIAKAAARRARAEEVA